eukprot:4028862-Pleurochrysis_carterae.AAC.2
MQQALECPVSRQRGNAKHSTAPHGPHRVQRGAFSRTRTGRHTSAGWRRTASRQPKTAEACGTALVRARALACASGSDATYAESDELIASPCDLVRASNGWGRATAGFRQENADRQWVRHEHACTPLALRQQRPQGGASQNGTAEWARLLLEFKFMLTELEHRRAARYASENGRASEDLRLARLCLNRVCVALG